MDTHRIAFIHTSPPAIAPLMQFYGSAAPELKITNLLEDGLLGLLREGDVKTAEARLLAMITTARDTYGAELAMITCSSVPRSSYDRLRAKTGLPIVKIDEPMARRAVAAGSVVGVAVTFPPTITPTLALLQATAEEAGKAVELKVQVMPEAYEALLKGDAATHDEILVSGVHALARQEVDAVVLAQVSMARVLPRLASLPVPALSSMETSLEAVRALLGQAAAAHR